MFAFNDCWTLFHLMIICFSTLLTDTKVYFATFWWMFFIKWLIITSSSSTMSGNKYPQVFCCLPSLLDSYILTVVEVTKRIIILTTVQMMHHCFRDMNIVNIYSKIIVRRQIIWLYFAIRKLPGKLVLFSSYLKMSWKTYF